MSANGKAAARGTEKAELPIERRIATGFASIAKAMRSRAWERSVACGLTPTQADILALLSSRAAPLRLSAIVEQLAVSAATASEAVGALVAKALVEKTKAHDDGRAIALRLTRAGGRMAAEVADWSDFLSHAADPLSGEEKVVVLRAMIKMIRHMQERGEIPAARMCVSCEHFAARAHAGRRAPHHCRLVDAPLAERDLRLDCPEHEAAGPETAQRNWKLFSR